MGWESESILRNNDGDPVPQIWDPVQDKFVPAEGKIQVLRNPDTVVAAPVTGIKTVTATAAELFAGASRLAGRRKMVVKNEHPSLRVRIGPAGVTQQNGFPVEPGAAISLNFDIGTAVPIYGISEGTSLEVSVVEC